MFRKKNMSSTFIDDPDGIVVKVDWTNPKQNIIQQETFRFDTGLEADAFATGLKFSKNTKTNIKLPQLHRKTLIAALELSNPEPNVFSFNSDDPIVKRIALIIATINFAVEGSSDMKNYVVEFNKIIRATAKNLIKFTDEELQSKWREGLLKSINRNKEGYVLTTEPIISNIRMALVSQGANQQDIDISWVFFRNEQESSGWDAFVVKGLRTIPDNASKQFVNGFVRAKRDWKKYKWIVKGRINTLVSETEAAGINKERFEMDIF